MKVFRLVFLIAFAAAFSPLTTQTTAASPEFGSRDFIEQLMRDPSYRPYAKHTATKLASLGEQVAVGLGLLVVMAALIRGSMSVACLCQRIRDWFCGIPRLSKEQRDMINLWRLRQIGKGRMDSRTAITTVPSEHDLALMIAEIKAEAGAVGGELTPVVPPAASKPQKVSAPQVIEESAPRVTSVIELVADPAFKVNMEPATQAFHEVVSDHREFLRELVRVGDFGRVMENFRREEERTHKSIRCACAVAEAMLDAIQDVYLPGRRVCRIKPERGNDGEAAYRCTFFVENSTGRRPLQASDMSLTQTIVSKPPEPEPAPAFVDDEIVLDFDPNYFEVYFAAFEATRADLLGLPKGVAPPPLNSPAQRGLDEG
jgi:hypothetical protein